MSTYPATGSLPESGSIVSRWLLDEASGNRADIVGSNTLVDNNTVLAGTGYTNLGGTFDNSADFELSNSEYLSIADASQSGLDITGDFSFSGLLKVEQLPSTAGSEFHIATKWNTAQQSYSVLLGTDDTLQVQWQDASSNATNWTSDAAAVVAGTWVHVLVSVDVSVPNVDIYLDGSEVASTGAATAATSIRNGTAEFRLGARQVSGLYYDGLMQDGIIWGGVTLTGANALSLYNLYITAAAIGAKGYAVFI